MFCQTSASVAGANFQLLPRSPVANP